MEFDKDIEKNKEFKENARDKITTELFLENLIIKVSDIFLIVVGKLTYSEQLLINKLKYKVKSNIKEEFLLSIIYKNLEQKNKSKIILQNLF